MQPWLLAGFAPYAPQLMRPSHNAAPGALPLQTDFVHGTVTGIPAVKTEFVTFRPDDPVRVTVKVSAELSCTSGTSCSWSTDALLLPGRYAATASGTDRQGNVASPGPSITVTVI